ncbi:MAG TPA: serine protease [Pyrinomonadaceae bacterium]|nr:serine protease [Pyrinomonadaceae bacterium]
MSHSPGIDRSFWQSAMMIVFVCAVFSLAVGQSTNQSSATRIAKVKQAVVIISTVDRAGKPLLQGSGFFVSADLVVTNLHVVKDAALIKIEMFDGSATSIQSVVAVNEKEDLALLKTKMPQVNVAVLQLADSAPAEGASIFVMSNPRGYQWKLTQGEVGPIWKFQGVGNRFQVSALILPGSSGAPVVNSEGRVVGIAAMHLDSSDNLNFAVSSESLRSLQASTNLASLGPAR